MLISYSSVIVASFILESSVLSSASSQAIYDWPQPEVLVTDKNQNICINRHVDLSKQCLVKKTSVKDFQTWVSDVKGYTTISLDKQQLKQFEFGLSNIYQQLSHSANYLISPLCSVAHVCIHLNLIHVTNGRIAGKTRQEVLCTRALQSVWDYQKISCQEECEKNKRKRSRLYKKK